MKNIMIVLNAVVYNRGSEALVRGISGICKRYNKGTVITLVSSEKNFGKDTVNIDDIDIYQKKESLKRNSILWYISKALRRLG